MKRSFSRDSTEQTLKAYAKAGEWAKAARAAAQLGDEPKLVEYTLLAALGKVPPGFERLRPFEAAQRLATQGHYAAAAPLFEHAQDFLSAGRTFAAAGNQADAARCFERAGEWLQAARGYAALGKTTEALHALDRGERALAVEIGDERDVPDLSELRLLRAELLLDRGRQSQAASLLRSLPPSARVAALLERAGLQLEAVQSYLAAGETAKAQAVTNRAANPERLVAEVHLRNGRWVEAGHQFARLGLAREAAEAYEAGQQWGYAAYRWEAAEKPKLAAAAYEKAGELTHAARCYAAAGMTTDALRIYLRAGDVAAAAELHVRSRRFLDAAALFLERGQKGRAAAILMQLQSTDAEFAMGTVLLAPLLIEEGFAADALERVRRIPAKAAGSDVDVIALERTYWEGRALEALQRSDEARACYSRVAAVEPGYRDVRARLAPPLAAPPPTVSQAQPAPNDDVLRVGSRVAGRYDILGELGRGGMGRVFKAHDLELGETVAIKSILALGEEGSGEEARLLRELQICRRISHPNVVRVYDLGHFAGGIFITMEYLEGRRLDQLVTEESPLSFARIRELLGDLAAGLREAHSLGVVHRDLKPSNVVITPRCLKILDFGIAATASAQARLTQAGFVMGSPMYMAPDQILGHGPDARTDLYSLGLLTYFMIAGRDPFDALEPYALVHKQLREMPADVRLHRPETPAPWVALLAQLLAKKREDRLQSAQELLEALAELPVDVPAGGAGASGAVVPVVPE